MTVDAPTAANALANRMQEIMLDKPPELIGAAMADLMARYLQGHRCTPRNPVVELHKRRELFEMWSESVWSLVAILDSKGGTLQ